MGLWGEGMAFSDLSCLKILIFSTDYGRFRGGEVNLPSPWNRVKSHERRWRNGQLRKRPQRKKGARRVNLQGLHDAILPDRTQEATQ